MTSTVVRWTAAGALALAGVGGLESSEVRAASKANSPKYEAGWPATATPTQWSISITPAGEVSGSYRESSSVVFYPQYGGDGPFRVHFTYTGSMTGVLSDGALQLAVIQTQTASSKNPSYNHSYTFESSRTATVVADADGNLQGTSDTGETFTWWRR